VDWFDMGRPQTLLDAATAVARGQGGKRAIGSPEAVAFAQGWIGRAALTKAARRHPGSAYGQLLEALARR
jgi:dTDP-glucose pyrophosphorylase